MFLASEEDGGTRGLVWICASPREIGRDAVV